MGSWIYQAYTENSILAFLTLISKILSTIFILMIVKTYDDLMKVFYIQLFFSALLGISAWCYLKKKYNITFLYKYISLSKMFEYSKESYHNFVASFFTLGFTYLNPFLVKYFFGDIGLGLYSIAEKITNVLKQSFFPVAQTFYADNCRLAMEKKYNEILKRNKKIFYFFSFLCLLAELLNIIFGNLVYNYLFDESQEIIEIAGIMIITQWVISIAIILVNLMIIPFGQSAILKKVYLAGLGFYLIIIYPMLNEWGLNGILYSILFTEILLTILFFVYIFNYMKIKNKFY
jgi:PST family polysaccharide transporter